MPDPIDRDVELRHVMSLLIGASRIPLGAGTR